jgi:predicted HD superfamily hydrolase involved in NAD metabolism
MEFIVLEKKLQQALSTKRFCHSVGVQQTARELATRFGADTHKAGVAGLLHDCAREMTSDHLLKRAGEFGIVVGSLERSSPVILHAAISAYIASLEYGILDEEIKQAIALHTTGGPNMSLLDKIIFLADYIEPHRDFPGVDKLRKLALEDLDQAVLAAFDQTIGHLINKRMVIHLATIEGRNALLYGK